jgi:hypothetical protein
MYSGLKSYSKYEYAKVSNLNSKRKMFHEKIGF